MMHFGMSKVWTMVLALGVLAMVAAPAEARGRRGGHGCHGGCYGGCYGGGYGGYGCCGGGCYGGGYGCCGGGSYGGGWGGGMYHGSGSPGSGSRIDYYGPYMAYQGYQSMPSERRSYYYSPSSTNNGASPATIQIRVPRADAQVWLDDYLTRQTGEVRTFETPALSTNSDATYMVRIRWNDNGKPMTETRQIQVRGGKQAELDLGLDKLPGGEKGSPGK